MNIENRIKKLESLISNERIKWKTNSGERVECNPEELFTAKPGDVLHSQILDADLSAYSGEGSLLEFVRAFLLSQPEMEH